MGGFSLIHWLILGVIVLLLFGKGRFSDMMGDVAKGLKSFKKGMSEDETPVPPMKHIEGQRAPDASPAPVPTPTSEQDKL
jgi:sec-independent protein translocase protein TatA